jgi:hypothetical protein
MLGSGDNHVMSSNEGGRMTARDGVEERLLTLVIGVLTAETITTSSAELINNLALPNEGIADAIFWIVEVIIVLVVVDRCSMVDE